MARGATNQKGPERAFLNAVDAILKAKGTLPVNLMVAAEGEEELGSTNYPEVIGKYEARLKKANGVFFPFNAQDAHRRGIAAAGRQGQPQHRARSGGWSARRADACRNPQFAES